jgi:hypothetical protein
LNSLIQYRNCVKNDEIRIDICRKNSRKSLHQRMDPNFAAKIIYNIYYKKITSCENDKKKVLSCF